MIIPTYIKSSAFEKIKWHRERGNQVVIVSASLDIYLKPWCLKHGLDLICTETASTNGRLTGEYLTEDCSSLEKKLRVKEKYNLQEFDTVYAYGDTLEDKELLGLADKAFYQYF